MVIVNDIKTIIEELNKIIVRNVNTIMLQSYWNIGRWIVEEEKKVTKKLSMVLYYLNNYLRKSLKNMVSFFQSQIYFL